MLGLLTTVQIYILSKDIPMPLIHQSIQPLMCQLAVRKLPRVTELSLVALNLEQENELNLRQTENGKKGYLAVRKRSPPWVQTFKN